MAPPKILKLREVGKIFRSFGISLVRGKTTGHKRKAHWMLTSPNGTIFPIAGHGKGEDVFRTYIDAARRAFHLTEEDGITDNDFYSRR